MTGAGVQMRKGMYMVLANTHANNYHIINDFLLQAFRAWVKTRINGLLIPVGCVDSWRGRLPPQAMMIDNLNLTVVYPLENETSVDAPMCFDRLIIQQFEEVPYHIRKGRFSRSWPREIFVDFRDSAHDYVRKLLQSEEVERGAPRNMTDVAKTVGVRNVVQTSSNDNSKPVLSWMSRLAGDLCLGRCITNEKDAVAQLSKYFHVKVLDSSAGLTTEQALACIMHTDVLVGLHGAGLAYAAFLPDRAMLVELRRNVHQHGLVHECSLLCHFATEVVSDWGKTMYSLYLQAP